MKLSKPKLRDRIDLWVAKFDPAGVRIPPTVNDNRYVEVGETSPGMAGIWANVHATDAAALDNRLDALAATVCENDPRTTAQRRADATGARSVASSQPGTHHQLHLVKHHQRHDHQPCRRRRELHTGQ